MRAIALLGVFFFGGCELSQFTTANAGALLELDAGCPPTWPDAYPMCRGQASPPCPGVARCTYVEMGDCLDVSKPCSDAVAGCDASDGGATWTCAQ